ncbi:MAG: RNA methyltransferase [Hydrogenophilales bacterium]|nr:RNA methyltransferase [Hydrogenophilales bacterium]
MNSPRVKHITSPENAQYKLLKKIATSSRERRKCGQTLLDGVHLLNALADAGGTPNLIALKGGKENDAEIEHCLSRFPGMPRLVFSETLFDSLSPVEHPTGVLGLINTPTPSKHQRQFCVLLEAIQDPGNLGAMLRTAAAAGVDAVYLSKGCAEVWSPKALRAGMGAQFALALHEHADLTLIARELKSLVATSLDARQSLYDLDLSGPVAFVFGNEGAGLSPALLDAAAHQVKIPMPGKAESLNVAAAAAVCLFECVRQRGGKLR